MRVQVQKQSKSFALFDKYHEALCALRKEETSWLL